MQKLPKNQLESKRASLDEIDKNLISLLANRLTCIREIAGIKKSQGKIIRDPDREQELLNNIESLATKKGVQANYVRDLYNTILTHSVDVQRNHLTPEKECLSPVVPGYQGVAGSYSQRAWQQFCNIRLGNTPDPQNEGVSYENFSSLIDGLHQGQISHAVIPVENKVTGPIQEALDPLLTSSAQIIGELYLPIHHCLLGARSIDPGKLTKVYSHPQALAQCSGFLGSLPGCESISDTDTARAALRIAQNPDKPWAAVAGEQAAEIYGLKILKKDIADLAKNWTRFLLLSKTPGEWSGGNTWKTTVLLGVPQKQGIPLGVLNTLEKSDIHVHGVTPRPHPVHAHETIFLLDCAGHTQEEHWQRALQELATQVTFCKILGSYPENGLREAAVRKLSAPKIRKDLTSTKNHKKPSAPASGLSEAVRSTLEKKRYRLASRLSCEEDRIIKVGNAKIGGEHRCVIAGPCSVESRTQIWGIAEQIASLGGGILRGGCFKPRTLPYDFQGLGYQGLEYLKEAGDHFGLPVVTEVMEVADMRPVAQIADIVQIGARNMQNFPLLREAGKINRPVILKRGLTATIDEWLSAAEYILAQGNMQVILCERGIRTYETATRNTLDLSAIPVVKERSPLPVIVDPSHASGVWRYINDLSVASMAVGSHGIMVEVHPEPEKALSDGPQSLTYPVFSELMDRINPWLSSGQQEQDRSRRSRVRA